MTPEELGAALVNAVNAGAAGDVTAAGTDGAASASVSRGGRWARATVDVPAGAWRVAVTAARDEFGCNFFDWLSAVDEGDAGFAIVAHLWSTAHRHGVLVRTMTPAAIESIVDIFPGAAWHERE